MTWLIPGDQVRLRPREAPHGHAAGEWWTVTNVIDGICFDAMRTLWLDNEQSGRHRWGVGFDQITAGPIRIGAEL